MTCRPTAWRPIEWTLRSAFERLSHSSQLADLNFYRDLLAKVTAAVGDDAPADVAEAYARLEHIITERSRIQARATRVLTEG